MLAFADADWRASPPVLTGDTVVLREVGLVDSASIIEQLSVPEVSQYIVPPPADGIGFERFVSWAVHQREAGLALYLSLLPAGYERAAGVMSLNLYGSNSSRPAWNWGFALGQRWWGTGLFAEAARLTLEFAFDTIGLPEVEAWSPLANGRAQGALRKLGGSPELLHDVTAPDGRQGTFVKWTMRPNGSRPAPRDS